MKKVSLADISKELGVSKTLVSFVMNGKAEEMRISEEMTEKVLLKAKEMGYKANYLAKALRTGKSNTIGLIVADISNTFFAKLARSIEDEAIKYGYNVIFGSSDEDSKKSTKLIDVFLDKKVDGLIICPSKGDENYIKKLQKAKIPNVMVDRYFSNIEGNIVVVNNKEGAFQIVEGQIKKRYKRIGCVNFNVGLIQMDYRLEGYKAALVANEIEYDDQLVKNVSFENIEEKAEKAVKELLENDVEVIFFTNNHLAFLGLKLIKEHNRKNKRQVSICSFDSYAFMDLLEVPIVYGVQPISLLGKNAVDLIVKQIDSDTLVNEKRVLPIDILEIK
ncbi:MULTISPECIES: LacI family DNA-binding transcriptional regulator [Flavobacteriaceae]|uniref:LacI family transcriptional regulator n=2 Tax=Flavobacteriaceae TaxID=49546 RepID=A0A4Y8AVN3_9FLAO|nr:MULTISPECIES: substrate-binding domain-containing protein [Flavobacteriaceae]TEW75543.1 LacI family transcriptional regulator [Gramella jeungdoensis]GGK46082.1 LacI family transcriptional regulator [Lutibacter litoralis]